MMALNIKALGVGYGCRLKLPPLPQLQINEEVQKHLVVVLAYKDRNFGRKHIQHGADLECLDEFVEGAPVEVQGDGRIQTRAKGDFVEARRERRGAPDAAVLVEKHVGVFRRIFLLEYAAIAGAVG